MCPDIITFLACSLGRFSSATPPGELEVSATFDVNISKGTNSDSIVAAGKGFSRLGVLAKSGEDEDGMLLELECSGIKL
jgi:hypothetical protein